MSWFDQQGDPTSSAPTAGTAPMTLGSLGQTTNTAPTAGAMPMGGSTSTGNLSDPSQWMNLVGNQQQLQQWVQQGLGPSASPDLVNYYVGKIQGQPGANPTEQAGSANYWMQKLQSDPNVTGQGGQRAGGASGVSTTNPQGIPGLDPGYAFQVQQAQQAIQRSAASKGTLLTGGTLKGLADYIGNDMASSAYQGAFGRSLSLANLGETAASGQASNNSGYGANAGNLITGGAANQAQASLAQGNLASGTLGSLGTLGLYGAATNPANVNGTATGYQTPANWATPG